LGNALGIQKNGKNDTTNEAFALKYLTDTIQYNNNMRVTAVHTGSVLLGDFIQKTVKLILPLRKQQ
jgi:hypothetical protein